MEGDSRRSPDSIGLESDNKSMQTEAFSTWAQWAVFYPPGSEERKLLEDVRNERWLVSVVHHDFKSPEALWAFLSEE